MAAFHPPLTAKGSVKGRITAQGGFLDPLGLGWAVLELLLGVGTLASALAVLWLVWTRTAGFDETLNELGSAMKVEGDLMKENMNHIAGAIVGLSELLDSADDLLEEVQAIPDTGTVIMSMIQNLILAKFSSVVPEMAPLIDNVPLIGQTEIVEDHGAAQGENTTTQ